MVMADGAYRHSLAQLADGSVWAWGNNNYGVFGNGSTGASTVPVRTSLGGEFANSILSYSLKSGEGDNDNSLFVLDQNGTLRTAKSFDFESDSTTYSIRYEVRDDANFTMEGNFTIDLIDVYEPSKPNHIVDLNYSVSMEMIWVEPGSFTMGSPISELGRGSDETKHDVNLTKGFYLGKYEVTQAQYEAVMKGNEDGLSPSPSNWSNNPSRPVEFVSWEDIQVFLTRLNFSQHSAGNLSADWKYSLPTEAQWEYACRAGTNTAYSWGEEYNTFFANSSENGIGETRDVGMYFPNPWGFYDMHGNVYEWTADWYQSFTPNAVTDPTGAESNDDLYLVRKGGSYAHAASELRSAGAFIIHQVHVVSTWVSALP